MAKVELRNAGTNIYQYESRRDAVLTLPEGAELFATNTHTPIHAFSIQNRIFGVQFHPEMGGDLLRHLWSERREYLCEQVNFDLDAKLDSAGITPEAERIFENFASVVRS